MTDITKKTKTALNPQWPQILNKLAKRLILRGHTRDKRVVLHVNQQLISGLTASEIEKQIIIKLMHEKLPTRYREFEYSGYIRLTEAQRYKPSNKKLLWETRDLLENNLNTLVDGRTNPVEFSLKTWVSSRLSKLFKRLLKNGKRK